MSGLVSAFSGAPFSITAANPQLNCPGCGVVVIDVVGDPRPTGTAGSSAEPWYDKSLFSQPTGATLAGFGNSARNQFRSPGVWNVDLSLVRSFRVGPVRPEIRVEAANVFNHTAWGAPVTTFTSPTFMTFTPTQANSGAFPPRARGARTPPAPDGAARPAPRVLSPPAGQRKRAAASIVRPGTLTAARSCPAGPPSSRDRCRPPPPARGAPLRSTPRG